jgi:outer membrane murein-binding lipoprotein Lpp
MKKIIMLLVIALLSAAVLTGCGVPQEDYNKAINERDTALARVTELDTEVAKLKTELITAQTEYSTLNATVEEWTAKRDSAFVYEQIVVELMAPAIGDGNFSPETIGKAQALVEQTGDNDLKEKFDTWAGSPNDKALLADLLEYAIRKFEELLS